MHDTYAKRAIILIVDDEKANVRLLEVVLEQAGYTNVFSVTDSRQAQPLFREIHPDIVLLDLSMPYIDGFGIMTQLAADESNDSVPILVLTGDATHPTRHKALRAGAKDFLTKPLDEVEVLLRIENLLENRFNKLLLEERVAQRTNELEISQLETLQRLALAAEYRDDDTGSHTRRVGSMASHLSNALGLPEWQSELTLRAALLHDVGKIGISDAILLKPGKLTNEEFAIMKGHTGIGAKILSGSSSQWLQMAEEIALNHHERWDGSGYMELQGDAIPLTGRIVAVADVFDALTHKRPYKEAWPVAAAVMEIESQGNRQFDQRVVDAFLTLAHEDFV